MLHLENCASITKCITHIKDKHIDSAENINITMSMYNLIEYNYNYYNTSGRFLQFKRDELPVTNDSNPINVTRGCSTHSNTNQAFSENQLLLGIMEC